MRKPIIVLLPLLSTFLMGAGASKLVVAGGDPGDNAPIERLTTVSRNACTVYILGWIPTKKIKLEETMTEMGAGSHGLTDITVKSSSQGYLLAHRHCLQVSATPYRWLPEPPPPVIEESVFDQARVFVGAVAPEEDGIVAEGKGMKLFEALSAEGANRDEVVADQTDLETFPALMEAVLKAVAPEEVEAANEKAAAEAAPAPPPIMVASATKPPPKKAEALTKRLYQALGKTPPAEDAAWLKVVTEVWNMRQQNDKSDADMLVLARQGSGIAGPEADLLEVLNKALDAEPKR